VLLLRGLACILITSLCWAQELPKPVENQPVTFSVHPEIRHQTVVGFGAGIYQGTFTDMESLSPERRAKLYDMVYGVDGLALNIIRFHISFLAEPLAAADPMRAKGLRYNWENDQFTQVVWKVIGPALEHARSPILYAVPFTPPPRWKTNHLPNFGGEVPPANYRDYAEYLADFIRYYKVAHGVTIDVISLQNEPDVKVYWESSRLTGAQLRDFLKVVGPVFRDKRITTRIMIPEGSTWDEAWIRAEPSLRDDEARGLIGILASHAYGDYDLVDRGRGMLARAAEQYGLPLWMSETSIIGPPDDPSIFAGLRVAHTVYRDLVEGKASAWIYCFVIFTSKFPGSMGVLSPAKNGNLIVPKRFWTIANYSHFVRPGWRRIDLEGLAFANSAFVSPDGRQFAIIALNATVNARPVTYDFGNFALGNVKAYCTSKDLDLAEVEAPATDGTRLNAKLAPFSVTTFVGSITPSNGNLTK
jgi:glucuronoarabinoxylan endo-1,4-beta-xylanase